MTKILSNGNLLITASNAERSAIAHEYSQRGYYGAEQAVAELLHERYDFIRPEAIGALTDAPILTPEADYSDEGGVVVPYPGEPAFWFPDYMVRDPWQELARKGRVIFQRAPEGN